MGKRIINTSKEKNTSQSNDISNDISPLLKELETELQKINSPTQPVNNDINSLNNTNDVNFQLNNSTKSNLFKFNLFGKKNDETVSNQIPNFENYKNNNSDEEKNSAPLIFPTINQETKESNLVQIVPDNNTAEPISKKLSKESTINLLNKKLVNISSMESDIKSKLNNIKSLMARLHQLNSDFSKKSQYLRKNRKNSILCKKILIHINLSFR